MAFFGLIYASFVLLLAQRGMNYKIYFGPFMYALDKTIHGFAGKCLVIFSCKTVSILVFVYLFFYLMMLPYFKFVASALCVFLVVDDLFFTVKWSRFHKKGCRDE